MDQDLVERVKERFAELPENIQLAIQNSGTDEILRQIGEEYQLHVDQVGILGDEVRLVMLGFADPDEFSKTLVEQIHLTTEEAQKVAGEVGTKIFLPIRESMKQFWEDRELEEAAETIANIPDEATSKINDSIPSSLPQKDISTPPQLPPTSAPTPKTEMMLTQPTVTLPTAPRPYKADPYREPAE